MNTDRIIEIFWKIHEASAESEMYKRPFSEETCALLLIYDALNRIDEKLTILEEIRQESRLP